MTGSGDRVSIGAFAANTQLSAKALRHYDALGLLTPAAVDPRTGYRRYDPQQYDRARRISLLRAIGMPLARIEAILDLDSAAAAMAIQTYWQDVEGEHASRRMLTRYLLDVLSGRSGTMYDIYIRELPERQVASILGHILVGDLARFIGDSHQRIMTRLHQTGAPLAGPPMVLYHGGVSETSDGPVEAVVPFHGEVGPSAEFEVRIEPAHREAYTRITKRQVRYPEILQAYDAVFEWLTQRRASITGPSRECYFVPRPWPEVGDDELAVDIAFPFVDPTPDEPQEVKT